MINGYDDLLRIRLMDVSVGGLIIDDYARLVRTERSIDSGARDELYMAFLYSLLYQSTDDASSSHVIRLLG